MVATKWNRTSFSQRHSIIIIYYYYYFAFLVSPKFSTQPYKQHLHLHPATRLLPVYSGLVRSLLWIPTRPAVPGTQRGYRRVPSRTQSLKPNEHGGLGRRGRDRVHQHTMMLPLCRSDSLQIQQRQLHAGGEGHAHRRSLPVGGGQTIDHG